MNDCGDLNIIGQDNLKTLSQLTNQSIELEISKFKVSLAQKFNDYNLDFYELNGLYQPILNINYSESNYNNPNIFIFNDKQKIKVDSINANEILNLLSLNKILYKFSHELSKIKTPQQQKEDEVISEVINKLKSFKV